jgi:hypothetical protein
MGFHQNFKIRSSIYKKLISRQSDSLQRSEIELFRRRFNYFTKKLFTTINYNFWK